MNGVLMTVSGVIDPDLDEKVAAGSRPKADYREMARAFGADLLDYATAREAVGWLGRLLEKLGGPNLLLAWRCYQLRRRYRVIFVDGEQVGIPLAFVLKFFGWGTRVRLLMIVHVLSAPKKVALVDLFGLASRVDLFFTYATWQKQFIEQRWKVPPERVVFTPFMVDADFFAAHNAHAERVEGMVSRDAALISTAGLEFRDYPTLMQAVQDLDVQVMIAAASPWSKRSDSTAGQEVPGNVIVQRFSQYELRDVYAASRFVVMPLYPVNFQAGVTAILEAMAMGKAVICTRTPGQTDVVIEGETGLYVPPGDPAALRGAIQYLLDHPAEAERMGDNGRRRVQTEMSLDCYVERLGRFVNG
jgi:glycosyltransferase involved in cell wall biosynthesis